ncbi:MAG: disulfide bond formation protein B [Hyphomonadaceae bacterium]|jgi:disulfide bond formation protein DsbB|nr:disulfide bond formation protein B [Hyphomonadaceae bacterium]
MLQAIPGLSRSPATGVGGGVLIGAAAVILAALGFEHIGGYMPCPLCLQQRYAYYAAIPLLLAGLVLLGARRRGLAAGLFLLVAVAFVANAGLGAYQAGAEWKFWDPPASCSAPTTLPSFDLKQQTFDRIPASCGVAGWRFLGLSFAGWNVVASLFLAAGAAMAALQAASLAAGGRPR